MLERVAIVASPLRLLCVALSVWMGAHLDRLVSAIPVPAAIESMRASEACDAAVSDDSAPRGHIRTRAPGVRHRFLTRDIVAPRAVRLYQQ